MSSLEYGKLVVLEGIDGSGKSTQARLLAEWLSDRGHTVHLTRQPGGTEVGTRIREFVFGPYGSQLDATATQLMLFADKVVHSLDIEKRLARGEVVVTDRYVMSAYAYGVAHGMEKQAFMNMYKACNLVEPDITFLIDVPVEEAMARVSVKQSYELMGPEFMQKVKDLYLEAARNPSAKIMPVYVAGDSIMSIQTFLRVILMRDYGL